MGSTLSAQEIDQFIHQGFVKIENAFPENLADAAKEILWRDMGCDPHDSRTWKQPVIRLGNYGQEPFRDAVNTPILLNAFKQLAGDNWVPRYSLGTFPVRFPSAEDPADTGWHVDASFPGDNPNDYLSWRINIYSRGRALLMLFLFSDVDEAHAPTKIIPASHLDVARILTDAGDNGLSALELAQQLKIEGQPQILATGKTGTVYLCHPFLVHAAQPNRGSSPRFLAQPPLIAPNPFAVFENKEEYCPVEVAIRVGLGMES